MNRGGSEDRTYRKKTWPLPKKVPEDNGLSSFVAHISYTTNSPHPTPFRQYRQVSRASRNLCLALLVLPLPLPASWVRTDILVLPSRHQDFLFFKGCFSISLQNGRAERTEWPRYIEQPVFLWSYLGGMIHPAGCQPQGFWCQDSSHSVIVNPSFCICKRRVMRLLRGFPPRLQGGSTLLNCKHCVLQKNMQPRQ